MTISGFDWDKGNWPKCAKHGLSKDEIEYVLTNEPFLLPDRSLQDDETRFNAVGKNYAGRYIFIVFTIRESGASQLMRPISARYMHQKEIKCYEQQKDS